jgi:hypothetical protein
MANNGSGTAKKQPAPAQVSEDVRFQERTWAAQRVGWWAMGLLLVAALAGVFAAGPLSSSEASDGRGALLVEYHRFQRHRAPATLQVHVAPEAITSDTILVHFNRSLVEAFRVERIEPEPDQAKVTPSGVEYAFATAEPGRAASLRFFLNAESFGPVQGEVGLSGREPARFAVFIYP